MSQPLPNPSDREMDILKCFWRYGDLSARELQTRIAHQLNWNASTTRTVLERMRTKGLLSRRDVHGIAVYSHVHPKIEVLSGLMRRLSAVLELDGTLPAAAFSGSQLLDAADIAELEAVLNPRDAGDGSK